MGRTENDFYQAARAAGVPIRPATGQSWLTNRGHLNPGLDARTAATLGDIFTRLGGRADLLATKAGGGHPRPDFVIEEWGTLIEVDEIQHFTTERLQSLDCYPTDLDVGFDIDWYRRLVIKWRHRGDLYRATKPTVDFPFPSGRRSQRAYFDSVRDLAASVHGWRLVRVPAPECDGRLAYRRAAGSIGR